MHQADDGGDATEDVNRQFGDAMRSVREVRGLSQRQLAELLDAAGMKLDPSAITRMERGTRDIKLAEAIAIAKVLDFSLEEFTYSPDDHFRAREFSLIAAVLRARKALLDAVRSIDRWVNNTDPETERRLIQKRGLSGVVDLYTSTLKQSPAFKAGGQLGSDGVNWTEYYNDDDRVIKQAIVDAVTDHLLVDEEFVEALLAKSREETRADLDRQEARATERRKRDAKTQSP